MADDGVDTSGERVHANSVLLMSGQGLPVPSVDVRSRTDACEFSTPVCGPQDGIRHALLERLRPVKELIHAGIVQVGSDTVSRVGVPAIESSSRVCDRRRGSPVQSREHGAVAGARCSREYL